MSRANAWSCQACAFAKDSLLLGAIHGVPTASDAESRFKVGPDEFMIAMDVLSKMQVLLQEIDESYRR
eukprot:3829143-Alexandrium_andersonii.AAC.1